MQLITITALVCLALLSPATVSDADDDTGASHVIISRREAVDVRQTLCAWAYYRRVEREPNCCGNKPVVGGK